LSSYRVIIDNISEGIFTDMESPKTLLKAIQYFSDALQLPPTAPAFREAVLRARRRGDTSKEEHLH
jgi:hypothetical protein